MTDKVLEKKENRGGRPLNRKAVTSARRDEVIKLALAGESMREIARKVGVTHRTVAKDIHVRLSEAAENNPATQAYRELQRQRINRLLVEWWPKAMTSTEALDRVIRLMEREARLLGLDTPQPAVAKAGEGEELPSITVKYVMPQGVDPVEYTSKISGIGQAPGQLPAATDPAGEVIDIEAREAAEDEAKEGESGLTAAEFLGIVDADDEVGTPE